MCTPGESMKDINSLNFLKSHWFCWKLLGSARDKFKYKAAYTTYAVLINIFITLCYPLHLAMSVFRNGTQVDDVKNLAMIVTCTACSLKFFIYAINMHKVTEIEQLLRLLDKRVISTDDRLAYQMLRNLVRNIFIIIGAIYLIGGVAAELSFIFREDRGLMFPAWFPFDWRKSNFRYYIANIYQIAGIGFQLMQNYVADCFPPVVLCLISGHIKLLGMRLSRIGYDNKSLRENEAELVRCIEDHQCLYQLFQTISEFMSMPMFIQLTVAAFNICISVAALLFFMTAPMDRFYFVLYFIAMPTQIFPTCYFGTDNEILFGQLHYAAFSSNWTCQSRIFKRNLIFFVERSMQKTTAVAGGMLRVHVDTFFSTLKGAYSLFTVIIRIKN